MGLKRIFLSLFYLFFGCVKFCHLTMVVPSTLDNQHVIVAAIEVPNGMKVTRNSTGHIIKVDGSDWKVLQWLSAAHINTTFDIIFINPLTNPLDKSGDKLGVLDLVGKGEYDMMTNSVPTPSRAALVDFSHPIVYAAVSYLIPSSYQWNNIFSATKPFQTWVWVSLLMSMLVVYATFMLIEVIGKENKRRIELEMIFYVIGIILYQASAYRLSKRLAIRLVIATWSIGALLLINYYNSLCISFFTISIKNPLIQSIQELPNRPDIRLVTDKNRNTAALLLSAESGLLKGLGDKLRADPGSLCNLPSQCVNLVKQGKSVYAHGRQVMLMKVLKEDFEATGKCNMELGKENFMELKFSWALQKKSPYMDPLNKSFMRLVETGLFKKWFEQDLPKVEECTSTTKTKRDQTAEGREPLPLKAFTGTFIILLTGAFMSLTVLVLETCVISRIIIVYYT